VIRLREILDPELREKVRAALAERRGMTTAGIPDWWELDDADYVDVLNEIRDAENPRRGDDDDDPRM
jgi:hypothetical protein